MINNMNWDIEKRIKILQKMDSLATREYHWAFGWGAPYGYRSLNWNKFGMPESGISYDGNWLDPIEWWWIDPEKKAKLQEAFKDENIKLPIREEIIDYWNTLEKD